MAIRDFVHLVYTGFEIAVVLCILGGFLLALARSVVRLVSRDSAGAYQTLRVTFGHSILLALELLIAADLLRTLVVDPTLYNLGVLAGLITLRTLLSWALEVEIDGQWPWNRKTQPE